MDYIREELLRQQRALAALMTGGEDAETAEDGWPAASDAESAGAKTDTGAAAAWSGRGKGTSPAAPEYAGAEPGGEAGRVPAEDAAAEETDGTEGPGEPGVFGRRSGENSGLLAGGAGRAGTPWGAAGGKAAGDAGLLLSETAAPWETAGFPADAGGAAGARALSLAFQRDARRYDGGFSLY
ncbi:MAG: hypothetical protein Q4C45_03605 [Oscillospiraceae bacterium]|nr:hypothetical protein [Oscillospiraceae bacterium]